MYVQRDIPLDCQAEKEQQIFHVGMCNFISLANREGERSVLSFVMFCVDVVFGVDYMSRVLHIIHI